MIAIAAKARAAATYDAGRFFDEPDRTEAAEMRLPDPFVVDQDFASEMFFMLVALALAPKRVEGNVGDSKTLLTFVSHAITTRGVKNFRSDGPEFTQFSETPKWRPFGAVSDEADVLFPTNVSDLPDEAPAFAA